MSPEPSAPLRADVVYLTPTGRRCRWVPLGGPQHRVTAHAFFEYLHADGSHRHGPKVFWADGFVLAPPNYRLLRLERVL